MGIPSLKLTVKAPENGWLEYDPSFWEGLFLGAMLVPGRVFTISTGAGFLPSTVCFVLLGLERMDQEKNNKK